MTETESTPEAAWIVRAEWVNSSPTYHGCFVFAQDAEHWARRTLDSDAACTGYELAIISPTQAVRV